MNLASTRLFLIRGLPHSGRTTAAKAIQSCIPHSVIFDFAQCWDHRLDRLGAGYRASGYKDYLETYDELREQVNDALNAGFNPIVVHNFATRNEVNQIMELTGSALVFETMTPTHYQFSPEQTRRRNRIADMWESLGHNAVRVRSFESLIDNGRILVHYLEKYS